jgi:predicted Ser/Thr protein kinase
MSSPLRPDDPRRLGDYVILSRLGEGGMGSVYLGRAPAGQAVAIKVIKPEFAHQDEFRARFRSEVSRARQVPPFCTAEVLDADPDHRTPYLVVEYVDGPNLAEVVARQGPLTAGNLHSVAIGVATALAAIHGAGVIHRDLKPANVLFSLGTPKVIDFGIARAIEVTSVHTRTDHVVGTVAYMAPERFEDDRTAVTPAADVFAWGAVVAYAGTGRTPFAADSAAATLGRILTQPPTLAGLTGPLRDLVALTLAKDPADRPTAHELLDMLLAAGPAQAPGLAADLAGRPELRRAAEAARHTGRRRTGNPSRRGKRRRRSRWAGAAVATAVLALGGAVAGVLVSSDDAGTTRGAAALRVSRSPVVLDLLEPADRPTLVDNPGGRCALGANSLAVVTGESAMMRCPGPEDVLGGDQDIAVDVTLRSVGSCAVVFFRTVGASGYRAVACNAYVQLEHVTADDSTTLASDKNATFNGVVPQAAANRLPPHRLGVSIRAEVATLTVDGKAVIDAKLSDPALSAGTVGLGAGREDGAAAGGTARFSNAEVRSA